MQRLKAAIERLPSIALRGRVAGVVGLVVEIEGLEGCLAIGDRCRLRPHRGESVTAEVIGLGDDRVLAMPLGALAGVGLGCPADVVPGGHALFPDERWLGRTIDGLGEAADGLGPLPQGCDPYPLRAAPPPAAARRRIGGKIDLGVRAVNVFATCCRGQRMGIVSGSGVGKSTLLAMMARNAEADVNVIGLVGERGREAREFVEDHLGEAGRARSVVVVATSDQPPLLRRQAAYATLAVAEYFRDRGRQVLCMMDSVTRFAMAQREIGLSAGEPPATKGYTPSMFAELPRLLERAGPGPNGSGDITGLFTVLVEGDDLNEPVVDAVRGILDGHIVLDRSIAERGRFPAVSVLKSLSRTLPDCNAEDENTLVERARRMLATYDDMAELIRLGAYRRGSDPEVDEAVRLFPALDDFLRQGKTERSTFEDGYGKLRAILDGRSTTPASSDQRAT